MILASAMLVGAPAAYSQQRDILKEVLARGTIRIATTSDLPPYSMLGANGQLEGYDVEMGKMIAEELGVKPEFLIVDAAGRITSLQTGKADITI